MANDDYLCPHCRADLREGRGYRTISVEKRGIYDGGLFWECPDCHGRWHRWPPGHYLRQRAHRYVRNRNGSEG